MKKLVPDSQDKPQKWKRQPDGYSNMPYTFPIVMQLHYDMINMISEE